MPDYRIIDADCHVVEPPHLWTRWLPKQYHERAPKLIKDEAGGDAWSFGPGVPIMKIGLVATPGMRFEDISQVLVDSAGSKAQPGSSPSGSPDAA